MQDKNSPVIVRALLFIFLSLSILSINAQTVVTITTTGGGSWTVPPGVTSATIYLWGGGGGAGGSKTGANWANGGGGGGGACGYFTVNSLVSGDVYNYTVGTGGNGGTAAPTAGSTGGTTTFAGAAGIWSADGGAGGFSSNGSGGVHTGGAGSATVAGVGITAVSGGMGSSGSDGSGIIGIGGGGGGSSGGGTSPASTCAGVGTGGTGTYPGGLGGKATQCSNHNNAGGAAGAQPAAGGGGANCWSTSVAGGAGGAGEIIIVYTISLPTITSFTPTSGCSGSLPLVTITGTNFSSATAVSFNGTAAASYTVVNATTITATPAAGTTTGTITVTTPGGTATSGLNFTVNASPTATITPSGPSTFCGSGSLTAGGGGTYLWNATGGGGTGATISASASGTYTVTVTNGAGCTAAASNVVTINPIPAAPTSVTATAAAICVGQTSQLNATSAGNTINWWTAATGGTLLGNSTSGTNYPVTPASTTTYYAEALTAAGCVSAGRVAVTVGVNPLPSAAITPAGPSTFCGLGTLTASGGGTYQWNAAGGSATTAAITASASGTYTVTVTTVATGCSAAASNIVTINPLPSAAITPAGPSTFCGSGTLTASGGGTYLWNATGGSATTAAITASASGTYTVTVTSAAGCTAAASNVVTVNPVPVVAAITGPTTVCAGSTITLSDGTAGGTWSSSNNAIATITAGGVVTGASAGGASISYRVTNGFGCSTTVTYAISVLALPSAAITPAGPSTFCSSGTLTASGGGTYQWNATGGSATTAAITASATGTYTVTVTSAGCTAAASNNVTINPLPAVAAISGANNVCIGSTITLSDGTLGGIWSSSNSGVASVSVLGVVSGVSAGTATISYTVTNVVTGCTNTATQLITVNALPSAAITPAGPSAFCGPGTLTASGGGNYQWNATGGSATTAAITASASGTYIVTVTTPATGCTASASSAVIINAIPAAPTAVTATAASICAGQTSQLNATSAGNTIRWWTAATGGAMLGTSASGVNYAVTPATTTTYYAESYTGAGCTSATRVAVTVNVNAVPTATITPTGSTTFCAGGSVKLTAGGGGTYVWSSGPTTASITVSPATTTTYTVTVTNGATCTATASQLVTVNTAPTPSVNSPSICPGGTATLTATAGYTSYVWSTTATTSSISVSPASSTVYNVTVTNASGCTAAASGTVTVVPNPVPTVTNPATCAGGTDTLTATGAGVGGTYHWNTGSTNDTVLTKTAGLYTVTVTNSAGCSATAEGIATVNPIPTPSVPNDTVCIGTIATLTASGGVIYVWSTGATTASITTATAGTYTVTATNIGGCTATASGAAVMEANPSVTATNGVICSGTATTVTASGASSYVWSTGAITASITTTTAGTYTVTGTSSIGCTASATSSVTTSTNPTPTVNNPSICAGNSATLTATGGATYLWSTGATTASITVSPASNTPYTVTATNAAGCSATASGLVTVNALPSPSATNGVICTGVPTTPATITASGGTSYLWSTSATTASITVSVVGTYTVTVTNAAGCTASASSTVTTSVKPVPTVNSTSACKGTNVTLTATPAGDNYNWNTGATTVSISVAPASTTTYTVTVTNAAGCSATASGVVTVYPLPTVTATSNSPVLLNGTINLTATAASGTSPYTYSWSGPAGFTSSVAAPTIASAQPTNGGVYTVTVTDAHGCTVSGSTTVILNFKSPGGITSNDALWLNSNIGVSTTGANVTTWTDLSGLANNASTVNGTNPTLVASSINSYPVINFAGAGGLQGPFGTNITSSSVSAFVVTDVASASNNTSGVFSIVSSGGTDHSSTNSAVLFQKNAATEIASYRNNAADGNYTNANAMGQYHLFTSIYSGPGNTDNFYHEGAAATNAGYASTAFAASQYEVGSRSAAGVAGNYLTGQIAEVVLFNTALTAAQKNQVESYLALKYGLTLNQATATNYVASNGAIFWNATLNGTFNNNIFGVGIDNIDTLNQVQSVSYNTNQLSINSATGLTYYSFLMVSDNGVPDTLDQKSGLPNNINAALTTVWRASQTGSRCTANFVLNTSTINFNYYAPISSSMTPYMLIDTNADGIYETYVAASSTSGSNITFNYSLKDSTRFTFGFKASIDYGDAWGVPTLTANNGAGHLIVPGVYMGSLIDAELDGQPSVNAVGDDTIGLADEDGVNFNIGVPTSVNIVTMGSNTITVTASTAGYLNAWADLNQDNAYSMTSEYVIINKPLVAGVNVVTFNVSDSVEYGPTSMRFRFAQHLGDVTAPTGLATNGEVEDYKIYVTAPLVGPCTNGFQNPSFELGPDPATYLITSETNLPYWRTTATDHMIEQWHSGFNGIPAYNGTYFVELEANLYGALYQDVYTTPGTKLSWSFAHHGRLGSDTCQLWIGAPGATVYQTTAIDPNTAWGVWSGFYTVPAGQYITRLEFWATGSYGGNESIGNELDEVSVISSFDYGDAPDNYGTLFASNGPYHSITGELYLGYGVTCDADGKPSAAANLDSLDDGITFPAPCNGCNTYTVNINAYNNSGAPATIAGWIDFNKNGQFDNNERASVTIPSSASEQSLTMTFNVTAFSAVSSSTYGRFRIANDSTQIATPYGFAASGEVEDYKISCVALPLPVPTINPNPACARGPLTLAASDSATFTNWTGPNGFTCFTKDTTVTSLPSNDSGTYTAYAIYSNGCVTDSSVYIKVSNCVMNITGNIFDDANGNGIIDGTDATTDLGQVVYAVLSDNTNTVLQTSLVNATGTFTFNNAPAYMTGMTIQPKITNPAVGSSSGGAQWPPNWAGTKEQYGTNNLAGSGVDATPNLLVVNTGINNITGALLGFDQLPKTTIQNYTIPHPPLNSQKNLIPANALGILAGSDPEDGIYSSGSTFTITSLSGMNGNQLYYDANGDGILQSYEQITGYTTITNFDPTKLFVKFTGAGSTSATFNYGSTDAASKVDPHPATYTIQWVVALPVKMLYFTADKVGETSLLKWATASEINNDHFDVERSADGETWDKIGQVKGAGTTEVETDYSMTDVSPLSGANYYRLKQVDVDGNFEYSNIAEVTFGEAAPAENMTTLNVYPNPLNQPNKLNIALTSTNENIAEVNIVNEIGQVVYNTPLPEIQNYQIIGLNLPSGVYIVSVRTQANNVLTSRLVITR